MEERTAGVRSYSSRLSLVRPRTLESIGLCEIQRRRSIKFIPDCLRFSRPTFRLEYCSSIRSRDPTIEIRLLPRDSLAYNYILQIILILRYT